MTTEQATTLARPVAGIIGRKLGMTQVFDDAGAVVPVTVIEAGPCTVTQVRTPERDGYTAVQLAFGRRRRVNKPLAGHLAKAGLTSAEVLAEFRMDGAAELPEVGTTVTVAEVFAPGQRVDVTGTSKGKGFSGVMKRHGFAGMGDGHGVKKKNRHPGAVGACATPGRTFRGQRMAGRAGNERVTVQNLLVVLVDAERNLLVVKGAVPGRNGSIVLVRPTVRNPRRSGGGERS